jgi:hypothetical protein
MQRHLSQKICLAIAVLCYLAAVACGGAAYLYQGPVRASLLASVVFFVGCGVVLQVIGSARLRGILSHTDDNGVAPPGD